MYSPRLYKYRDSYVLNIPTVHTWRFRPLLQTANLLRRLISVWFELKINLPDSRLAILGIDGYELNTIDKMKS